MSARDQNKVQLLLQSIRSGNRINIAAADAGLSYATGINYYKSWRLDGTLEPGLRCKCGLEYVHKGSCRKRVLVRPEPQPESVPEHYSVVEWGEMLISIRHDLFQYALVCLKDRYAAEELCSATIEKCFRARLQFTRGTSFKAWIFRCFRNNWFSLHRTKKFSSRIPIDELELHEPTSISVKESATNKVLAHEIIVKIAREFPSIREVCFLCWLDGKTYEEIAAIRGVAVGTIKSQLSRARMQLAKICDEDRIRAD